MLHIRNRVGDEAMHHLHDLRRLRMDLFHGRVLFQIPEIRLKVNYIDNVDEVIWR